MTQGRMGISGHSTLVKDYTSGAGAASYVQALAADLETDGLILTFNRLGSIPSIAGVRAWAAGYDLVPTRVLSGATGKANKVKFAVYPKASHAHAAPAFTGAALAAHQHALTGATFTGAALGNHQHDITTVAAGGGGTAMLTPAVAGPLEGGAQTNTNAVDAASGGTPAGTIGGSADAITAGTPAGTVAAIAANATTTGTATELTAAQNISGVTFYGEALGYA